ncbi:MAG: universal stress protein [Actinomycetota bacterium]
MTTAPPYPHICCCVDDSDASRTAVREAARLRALGPGRLTVVHALEPMPMPVLMAEGAAWYPEDEAYVERVRAWLDGIAGEVGGEAVLVEGYPAAAIVDWAAQNGVDLLVAAAHRGRVERVLLGSFAGFLIRHAPCPVLVVRDREASA